MTEQLHFHYHTLRNVKGVLNYKLRDLGSNIKSDNF